MAFRLSIASQNAACNGIVLLPDSGGTTTATGLINIYTGTQPATPDTTATGTLLVSIPFNNPSFGSSSSGTATMVISSPVSATVTTSGTAGWFRVVDRGGNPVFDGNISTSGSDMNFSDTSFLAGGTAVITSMTITVPM